MDPATITIISVLAGNFAGCFIIVCSLSVAFYCVYSRKSKKNSIELTNTSPDGGETKLKFEYQSEEKSSSKGGIIKLGKASTTASNGDNKFNEQYHISSSTEIMNANTDAIVGCTQAFTKAVESNDSVRVTIARNKKCPSLTTNNIQVISNSSEGQLYKDIHDQASRALEYLNNPEEKEAKISNSLGSNSYDADIV